MNKCTQWAKDLPEPAQDSPICGGSKRLYQPTEDRADDYIQCSRCQAVWSLDSKEEVET